MYKHILLPIDGSATSQLAVSHVVQLAKSLGSRVSVLYVIDPYPFAGVGADFAYGQANYISAANAEADLAMERARADLAAEGLSCETSVMESSSVSRGILETASAVGADLIVMGSHGRRGLEKLVLGSVAQRVVSHAHVTVMVVRDPSVQD
jgi:nucleotide-binding universal stress UspA family protein